MNLIWLRKNSLLLITVASILMSFGWTFTRFQAPSAAAPETAKYLIFIPDYQITARKSIAIWSEGTQLEQGRAAYFYSAEPLVNVTPKFEISGIERGQLDGTIQANVILRALNEKGEVYWTFQLRKVPVETFTLTKGIADQSDYSKFTAKPIALDVSAAYAKIQQISGELAFKQAVFQMVLACDINLSGTVNDTVLKKSLNNILPLTLQDVNFTIPKSEDAQTRETLKIFNLNKDIPGDTWAAKISKNWSLLLVDVVLLLLLLFTIIKKDKPQKGVASEHRRFKEWITEGIIHIKDRVSINVNSLEGLVDLAIDLDKRVIHDSEMKKYYVLEENLVYVYDPEKMKSIQTSDKQQLGKLLLERGLLQPEQLEIGRYYQDKISRRLGESLIALGFIDEITLYSTLASQAKFTFIEVNPEEINIDSSWFSSLTLKKARVLEAVPLGERKDGKLVVACGDPFKEGVQDALQELFNKEIIIVVTRPSVIFKLIEELELKVKGQGVMKKGYELANLSQRLSQEELTRFTAGYEQGIFIPELFIKATGLVSQGMISRAPETGLLLQWLVNRLYIDSDTAHLLRGLGKATEEMDVQLRQEKHVPELIEVLGKADYLTAADIEWLRKEVDRKIRPFDYLLIENYLASSDTVKKAQGLLNILENILNNRYTKE